MKKTLFAAAILILVAAAASSCEKSDSQCRCTTTVTVDGKQTSESTNTYPAGSESCKNRKSEETFNGVTTKTVTKCNSIF